MAKWNERKYSWQPKQFSLQKLETASFLSLLYCNKLQLPQPAYELREHRAIKETSRRTLYFASYFFLFLLAKKTFVVQEFQQRNEMVNDTILIRKQSVSTKTVCERHTGNMEVNQIECMNVNLCCVLLAVAHSAEIYRRHFYENQMPNMCLDPLPVPLLPSSTMQDAVIVDVMQEHSVDKYVEISASAHIDCICCIHLNVLSPLCARIRYRSMVLAFSPCTGWMRMEAFCQMSKLWPFSIPTS